MIKNKFEQYLRYVSQLSSATIDAYISDVDLFEQFVKKDLLEVIYDDILNYFDVLNRTLNSSSLARKMSSIRHFYQYCLLSGQMNYDPTIRITVSKKEKPLPKYLTLNEISQLISFELKESEDYLDRALIEVLFGCGLRVSECTALQTHQFFKEEGFFKILGKGNKERIVFIHQNGLEILKLYQQKTRNKYNFKMTSYLFVNSKSMPLTRQSVYNRLKKRQHQVGLKKDVSPHILRHSFASALINNDADLRVVQELLGHSSISTTQIYTHLQSSSKKRMYDQFHPGSSLKRGKNGNNEEI